MPEFLLKTAGKKSIAYPIKMLESPADLSVLSNELAWRIYREMSSPSCPIDIAKKLGIHEQKVYYYIKKFRKQKLIREVRSEPRHGTIARFYQVKDGLFAFGAGPLSHGTDVTVSSPQHATLLDPFVKDGKLNARIIVGSPEPHGPWKARASDSYCAIDFALFLGSMTKGVHTPNYKLDTEVREPDLKANLILIGGPTVNMITNKINSSLPVRFELKGEVGIKSDITGKLYKHDECGMIVLTDNPWDKSCRILVLAGKRFQGTRAAIISMVKDIETVMQGNIKDRKHMARVVRGFDMDGDGVIDSSDLLE